MSSRRNISKYFTFIILFNFQDSNICYCCSVAVMSDSLQPHELQHARLPCPSLSP